MLSVSPVRATGPLTRPEATMTDVLEIETIDRLRVLRLNRPDRKNALTMELLWAIVGAVRDAARDDDVWAVAITGNGDAFCSGLDLGGAGGGDPGADGMTAQERLVDDIGSVGNLLLSLRVDCEKPVLAGVNGVAVGLGLSLAMAADVRIAAPTARFHPGYARVATSPDGGLSWTLPQAVGYERAMRFLLEQRMIDANEALALGLVGEVTAADDDFEQRFLDYGQLLAGVAPIAARQTKRMLMRSALAVDLEAHLREELTCARRGLGTDDSAEAIRAMTERDRPTFHGR
jgi:2-(1,2-epoxy-1,2-dihydrophenyl)acetyl-CoA isomerase